MPVSDSPVGDHAVLTEWPFPEDLIAEFSDYDREFVDIEFGRGRTPEIYRKRLQMLEFHNMDRVLDAGCGMGQWSLLLAEMNGSVAGLDSDHRRLSMARRLAAEANADNVVFMRSVLEQLPFKEREFSGVFCCGVFMFTDMRKSLREFHRVLESRGRLYLTANSWGWYAHLLVNRAIRNREYNWAKIVFQFWQRMMKDEMQNALVTRKWLSSELAASGFKIIDISHEGGICFSESVRAKPFYDPQFLGMNSILEVVAEKV